MGSATSRLDEHLQKNNTDVPESSFRVNLAQISEQFITPFPCHLYMSSTHNQHKGIFLQ
jgi:hypothetical protein